MTNTTTSVLDEFSKQRILVLGDFMLDEYVHGSVDRISQEAPVPVVVEREIRYVPGGAGNVVCNLRALGCHVSLAGTLGEDEGAARLRSSFAALGVSSDGLIVLPDRPTTRKTRILASKQQVCRVDREDRTPISGAALSRLKAIVDEAAPDISALIISDYDKGVVIPEVISHCVALAARHGFFVAVDPQITHFNYYKGVGVLTPNHHEAGRFLQRKLDTDAEVVEGGREIMQRLGSKMCLITRGDRGMTLFPGNGEPAHFPTMAREVFDVTGAGDTVISIFALAIAAGASPEAAVELSNRGAGMVVGHVGAATVTVDELRN